MKETPQGVRYAELSDSVDGPALAQGMAEDIQGLVDIQYANIAQLRSNIADLGVGNGFEGWKPWPRGPVIRGNGGGSADLSTSGHALVADRVRHLGSLVIADLILYFVSTPSLTDFVELELPYTAWSTGDTVGTAVLMQSDGVMQPAVCEQFGGSGAEDWTMFTQVVDGFQSAGSQFWSAGAQWFVRLMYESDDPAVYS